MEQTDRIDFALLTKFRYMLYHNFYNDHQQFSNIIIYVSS